MKKVFVVMLGLVCLFMGGDSQADCRLSSVCNCDFSDVPESHPFYNEITGICELGLTDGYSDCTYRPANNITRAAMSAFIMRTIELLQPALNQNLEAFASGSLTYYGPAGCESSAAGCTIITEGTVEGNIVHNGAFINTGTVLWINSTPNGSGGHCAPASGTETTTTSNGSTLTVQRTGMLCEVGASGSGKYTFNATYFITDGTQDFAGAKGTGIMICSVDANTSNVFGFAHGIIKK